MYDKFWVVDSLLQLLAEPSDLSCEARSWNHTSTIGNYQEEETHFLTYFSSYLYVLFLDVDSMFILERNVLCLFLERLTKSRSLKT